MTGPTYLERTGWKWRWGVTRIGQRLRPRRPLRLRRRLDWRAVLDGLAARDRVRSVAPRFGRHGPVAASERPPRHAAVIAIFDEAGLGPLPRQLWRFVDTAADAALGADDFLSAIGIDPALIAARDRGEIDRANAVLELLFSIDRVFHRVTPRVGAAIEARLCCGDYASVRAAAAAASTFEKIARLDERWPVGMRLGVLDAFLRDVAAGLDNPLAIKPADVARADRAADRLTEQMLAFDAVIRATWRLHYQLSLRWPPHWGTAEVRARLIASTRSEAIERVLRRDRQLRSRDVDAVIAALSAANAPLERLMDRITSRTGPSAPAAMPPRVPTEFERALDFFGFTTAARPDRDTLRRRFRELARAMHPDRAGNDPASQQAAHARFVILNRHYDLLKLRG